MGSKLNIYGVGDVVLTNMMASENALTKGFHQVSLTNWSTTAVPQVSLGSLIECDGALYQSTVNESIGGSTADGTLYIKSVPSSSQVTYEFSTQSPVWDMVKQGWYTSTSSNERYLEYYIIRGGANYYKYYNDPKQPVINRLYTATMSANVSGTAAQQNALFDTIIDDTLSEYDSVNKRIKIKKPGKINVNILLYGSFYYIDFGPTTVYMPFTITIKKSGTQIYNFKTSGDLNFQQMSVCFDVVLNDYIEIFGDGGAVTNGLFTVDKTYSYLQITDY